MSYPKQFSNYKSKSTSQTQQAKEYGEHLFKSLRYLFREEMRNKKEGEKKKKREKGKKEKKEKSKKKKERRKMVRKEEKAEKKRGKNIET